PSEDVHGVAGGQRQQQGARVGAAHHPHGLAAFVAVELDGRMLADMRESEVLPTGITARWRWEVFARVVVAALFAAVGALLLLVGDFWVWPIALVILGASSRTGAQASDRRSRGRRQRAWDARSFSFAAILIPAMLGIVIPLRSLGVPLRPWVTWYVPVATFVLTIVTTCLLVLLQLPSQGEGTPAHRRPL
ncbi:hypothetical protein, partial [Microbacterium sp. K41]|uniref:hypothetical protein n=1 Tax=Microbacterium sp. K41 TaxID=2305437 RepID=UPI00197B52CF